MKFDECLCIALYPEFQSSKYLRKTESFNIVYTLFIHVRRWVSSYYSCIIYCQHIEKVVQ